ncbi:MAG TPA: hypothetical protein VJS45_02570 [Acidimicrobiia bacterium]|nr:hypothetical protein [Acidimicrobiia bacterium]
MEVGRTFTFGEETVEVVATLADSTQTVVAYRAPATSDLFPSPVELMGGCSGGRVLDDLLVAHLPPAEGSGLLVDFGRRTSDHDSYELELPIDRMRTRPYERWLVAVPAPTMTGGVRVEIVDAAVGLLMTTVKLEITADDPAVVAARLGPLAFLPSPYREAGSGPLWREWIPRPEPTRPASPVGDEAGSRSGAVRAEMRAEASATARFTKLPPGAAQRAPAPARPDPAVLVALPRGEVCARQGASERPGATADRLSVRTELQFDAPSDDASQLELRLNELVVFRRCEADPVDVPAPRADEVVNLSGRHLRCGPDTVELLRWVPDDHGTPRLVVRPVQAGLWPDIRIVAGNASVSLWLHPGDNDDELTAGLPGRYRQLFPPNQRVTIGLRMVGRRADIPPITLPLTPAPTD